MDGSDPEGEGGDSMMKKSLKEPAKDKWKEEIMNMKTENARVKTDLL